MDEVYTRTYDKSSKLESKVCVRREQVKRVLQIA